MRPALAAAAVALALAARGVDPASPSTGAAASVPSLSSSNGSGSGLGTWNDIAVPAFGGIQIPRSSLGREIAVMHGPLHALGQVSPQANGNYRVKLQTNSQGVTATGLVTGDTYRLGGATSDSWDYLPGGGCHSDHQNAFTMTSPGRTGNIVAHETMHVDIDASGNVQLFHVNFNAECK